MPEEPIRTPGPSRSFDSSCHCRIWRDSLAFDRRVGNLALALCDEFERLVERQVAEDPDTDFETAIDAVLRREGRRFTLRGDRKPAATEMLLTRYVDAGVFFAVNVDRARLGVELGDDPGGSGWQFLESPTASKYFAGEVRGYYPTHFFATPASSTAPLRESRPPEAAAERVRDALGLAHFGANRYLVAIQVRYVGGGEMAATAPTTLDAGLNPHFFPSGPGTDHGFTVHLGTRRRGLPEFVVSAVPFGPGFDVARVGLVTTAPEAIDDTTLEAMHVDLPLAE